MSSLSSYLLATLLLARATHIVPPSLTAATGRGTGHSSHRAVSGLWKLWRRIRQSRLDPPPSRQPPAINPPSSTSGGRLRCQPDGGGEKINASFARRRVVSGANHACLRLIKRLSTHFRCVVAWTSWIFRVHGSVLQAPSATAAAS